MRGHSFEGEAALAGEPDPQAGSIVDFAVVAATLGALRERLDHHLLNEIDGLALPTPERLAAWI
jgi:6-pyruvoyltetrahydropterin/6-carboxytetrahydropterin synthase